MIKLQFQTRLVVLEQHDFVPLKIIRLIASE